MNPIFADLATAVFAAMSPRASKRGTIDLVQGFPDRDGPENVRRDISARLEGPDAGS